MLMLMLIRTILIEVIITEDANGCCLRHHANTELKQHRRETGTFTFVSGMSTASNTFVR